MGAAVNEEGEIVSRPAPVKPLPGNPRSEAQAEDDEVEHAAYLDEIRSVLSRMPEGVRPDSEKVASFASESLENARRTLAKLRRNAESGWSHKQAENVPETPETEEQPNLPADLAFYDLRLPEVREAQANLAWEHGVYGFCYHHY